MKIEILPEEFNLESNSHCRKDYIMIKGIEKPENWLENNKKGTKFCNGSVDEISKVSQPVKIRFRSNKSKSGMGFKMTLTGMANFKGFCIL